MTGKIATLALGVAVMLLGPQPATAQPEPSWPALRLASSDGNTPVVGNLITGHTQHGLNQAIGRDGGRGVSPRAMLDAARNPLSTMRGIDGQGRPFLRYQGRDATVVTRPDGRIITTMPQTAAGVRNPGGGRGR